MICMEGVVYAKALDYLLDNKKKADELALAGYKRVVENFTISSMVKDMDNYYNELFCQRES